MQAEFDVALLGTGVAPLVAANRLASLGKSVIVLNPDWDFFSEDSELSFDPLWPIDSTSLSPSRLVENRPDSVLEELRPEFPGSVELWLPGSGATGFRDSLAPWVRGRWRVWVDNDADSARWELLESMYVEASDAGLHSQILEGAQVSRFFPGHTGRPPVTQRAMMIPRICDVDVDRYRNGLLEFARERLGPQNMICGANEIEIAPNGIRFYSAALEPRGWRSIVLKDGLLAFWTPRLTNWLTSHLDLSFLESDFAQSAVQTWEEWTLASRDPLDTSSIGVFEDMTVWAEVQGGGFGVSDLLSVLRPSSRAAIGASDPTTTAAKSWASQEAFQSLSRLARGFLGWDKFSIRSMRPRSVFDWENPGTHLVPSQKLKVWVVQGCDGPISEVVRNSRDAVEIIS